jgi:hypothetical protein
MSLVRPFRRKLGRCPYCFEPLRWSEAAFRCRADDAVCPPEPDMALAAHLGLRDAPPLGRVTPAPAYFAFGLARRTLACAGCGTPSDALVCPRCHCGLPHELERLPPRILAVLGAPRVGKSHYVAALLDHLQRLAKSLGGTARFLSEQDRELYHFHYYGPIFEKRRLLPPTMWRARNPSLRLPLAMHLDLPGLMKRPELLLLYATAGEDLVEERSLAMVERIVRHADGLILLMDPEPFVTEPEPGESPAFPLPAMIATLSAMLPGWRRRFSPIPTAFVLTKLDTVVDLLPPGSELLHRRNLAAGFDLDDAARRSDAVASQLAAWGGPGLVDTAARWSRDRLFCAVSSLGGPPGDGPVRRPTPWGVEDPLLWLLMRWRR